MRTIGRKYKNQIVRLVAKAKADGMQGASQIAEHVMGRLRSEAFDTWESAFSEIDTLIWKEISKRA